MYIATRGIAPHPSARSACSQGKGVILCLERALAKAGLKPEDVSYCNAHATSTPAGDMAEYRALRSVFKHDDFRMNSTKSMIGHLLGGAGAVEAIAAIKAIETGAVAWVAVVGRKMRSR